MKTFSAEIKEVGNPTILHPSITCEGMTKDELIAWWGLNLPDVEWFRLYQEICGERIEL